MRVKKDTQVGDQSSLLFNWDKTARKYFEHFDVQIESCKDSLQRNFRTIFTGWKDPSVYYNHFKFIDTLVYRQILGDISKHDVKDVNQVLGGKYHYTKSWTQPATMFAWDRNIAAFWLFSASYAVFGKFVKGYSIIWLAFPFIPTWIYMLYNYQHQPHQDLENAYRYIIHKRAATTEFEKNKSKIESEFNKYTKEKEQLATYLNKNNWTLYDFEAELYNQVIKGELK